LSQGEVGTEGEYGKITREPKNEGREMKCCRELPQGHITVHPMSWLAVTFTTQEINSLILRE